MNVQLLLTFSTLAIILGLLGAALAQNQPQPQAKADDTKDVDSSYGGIFNTPDPPYIHPDEYVQPENKQDKFDWKLTKVREIHNI